MLSSSFLNILPKIRTRNLGVIWINKWYKICIASSITCHNNKGDKNMSNDIDKSVIYIGNSLSQCVKSILSGAMPIENVVRIECGTMIPNFEALESMVTDGYFGYRYDKVLSMEVVEYLLFRGKIVQPRLDGDSKVLHEVWTPEKEWVRKDNQHKSVGQKRVSDQYTNRLNEKLLAQSTVIAATDVLEDTRVVEENPCRL